MSTTDEIGNEGTDVEQENEQAEGGVEVVDEVRERERNLRPGVEAEVQATVDYADERAHAGRLFGQTLVEEERLAAFEWEVERTRLRWDRRADSDREARSRAVGRQVGRKRWTDFERRAASVDPWRDPERPDAREQLGRAELGRVNREAGRIAARLDGWTRAAVSRLVAERVADGARLEAAVLDVMEELRRDPGGVVPIGLIGEVRHREVNVEGVVVELWAPSHPSIAQVGLLEDESGRTKLTSWKRSAQPRFEVGDRLRIRDAAKSWYAGRCSIALTGRSRVIHR